MTMWAFEDNVDHEQDFSRVKMVAAEPHSSVGKVQDLRTGGRLFDPQARPVFFPRIDDNHYNRIHFSLTAVHCFSSGYVGKQPVA